MGYLQKVKLSLIIGLLKLDFHQIFLEPDEGSREQKRTITSSSLASSASSWVSTFTPSAEEDNKPDDVHSPTNHTNSVEEERYSRNALLSYNDSKVWIYDEERKECLGWYGFSECGDVNLWHWRLNPLLGIQLQSAFDNTVCLGRSRLGGLKLRKCDAVEYFGRTIYWSYSIETGAFYSRSKMSSLFGAKCIVNANEEEPAGEQEDGGGGRSTSGSVAILEKCHQRFTPLSIIRLEEIVHQYQARRSHSDSEKDTTTHAVATAIADSTAHHSFAVTFDPLKLPDQGYWKCPTTKRDLPRNLDRYLGTPASGEGRQVLMGAGVFAKTVFGMKFNVYSVGWFVDAKAVQQDERFRPFYDLTYEELKASSEFNSLMTKGGGFNRSLFIKLAMTLKKDMVLQGLVEELQISRRNAKLLLEAGKGYTSKECPEGMEIIFTWKQGTSANDFQEIAELRIGDMVPVEIMENGLGEDFIYQYFREDDPVSEDGRSLYIQNFPLLLRSNYTFEPSSVTAPTPATPSSSSSSSSLSPSSSASSSSKQTSLKQWKIYFNSLLITKYHPEKEEFPLKVMIIIYLIVVILGSLPMIVRHGKEVSFKVVHKIKNSSSFENFQKIRRTLSRSTSLLSFRDYYYQQYHDSSSFSPSSVIRLDIIPEKEGDREEKWKGRCLAEGSSVSASYSSTSPYRVSFHPMDELTSLSSSKQLLIY